MDKMMEFEATIPYGIDLGTTNSAISAGVDGRSSNVLELLTEDGLPTGKYTMPSVVAWDGGDNFTVGRAAYDRKDLGAVVSSVKRLMQDEGAVVEFMRETDDGDGNTSVERTTKTAVEVSSLILRGLVDQVNGPNKNHGEIKDVVVTVPAYFNQIGVANTRKACELAGLNCIDILREPTAAALCAGLGDSEIKVEYAVVYDLGGGTFDVSLVRISDREEVNRLCQMYDIEYDVSDKANTKIIEPLYIAGDGKLGGDDYDDSLLELLLQRTKETCNTIGFDWDESTFDDLQQREYKRVMSQVKCDVAYRTIHMDLCSTSGEKQVVDVVFTEDDFEEAFRPIYVRTKAKLDEVLANAKVDVSMIILMGGSTKNTILRKWLRRDYDTYEIYEGLDPDESVAKGAGIRASAYLYGDDSAPIFDVLPQGIGVLANGKVDPILKSNATLPCIGKGYYETIKDDQTAIDLQLFQGNSENPEDCVFLGHLHIDGIEPRPKGESSVIVNLTVNVSSVLMCTAIIDGIKKEISIDLGAVQSADPNLAKIAQNLNVFDYSEEQLVELNALVEEYRARGEFRPIEKWFIRANRKTPKKVQE